MTYDYPGMYMSPSNQIRLARLVGEAFVSNNIDTRLFVYDHNWDQFTYPVTVLDDPAVQPANHRFPQHQCPKWCRGRS